MAADYSEYAEFIKELCRERMTKSAIVKSMLERYDYLAEDEAKNIVNELY